MNILDFLHDEFLTIFTYLLIFLGIFIGVFFFNTIIPMIQNLAAKYRLDLIFNIIDDVVTNVVLRIAFSHEDFSRFEQDAKLKNRDIRLVAAMHLIDQITTRYGIDLDEDYIISKIEAKLVELKREGIIKPHGQNTKTTKE